MNLKNKIKHDITSFLFCPKKAIKNFWKFVEKVLTNKKRYSIMQNVRTKKADIKYIEK